MVYEFDGTKHERLRDMRAARRAKHPEPVRGGTDFTRAAHAAGAPKRPGKAWRNGRTRSTGRNGRPLSDRCRGGMDKPGRIDAGHLCMDGRIAIADMHRAGSGVRAIARTLGRAPSTISRELRRNADDIGGAYGPHRARQTATHRPRRSHARSCRAATPAQTCHATGHVARRHRGDGQSRRLRFREPMVMAGDRPAEVADRAVPGHWGA